MAHSSNRYNIGQFNYAGENLYWKWMSGSSGYDVTALPSDARNAVQSWYDEMKYYQYGGENAPFKTCPTRVRDNAVIGHMTQVGKAFKPF